MRNYAGLAPLKSPQRLHYSLHSTADCQCLREGVKGLVNVGAISRLPLSGSGSLFLFIAINLKKSSVSVQGKFQKQGVGWLRLFEIG